MAITIKTLPVLEGQVTAEFVKEAERNAQPYPFQKILKDLGKV